MDGRPHSISSLFAQDFLHTFVQAVHCSPLDPQQVGTVAIRLLTDFFSPQTLVLYQADEKKSLLHLLAQSPIQTSCPETFPLHANTREPFSLVRRVLQQRKSILLADLHDPEQQSEITKLASTFVDQQTRGCLYLPLWCGDILEGVLIAGFARPLVADDWENTLFISCGLHLATALAHTRVHLTMADTRLRLQEILDQAPEGLVITEATMGTVRYANPMAAQILGIPLQDLINAPLQLPLHAQERMITQQQPLFFWTFAVARALSGKTLQQVETVVVRPDGTQIPVLCSSAPLRATQGLQAGAILIIQDITLQKRLEHDKNVFLSLASHELRTPLTTIMGYADLLMQEAADDGLMSSNRQLLHTASSHILDQSEHMAFLIDEMLDLSALDQDQLALHLAPYDLVSLLTQIIDTQAVTTKAHQLSLILGERVKNSGYIARIDAHRLIQALTNLVSNAIKYSPQGGDIEIGMRLEGQPPTQVLIWVKDHGLGIPQADLSHVFDRFYRSPKLDESLSGFGIGLYLARQMIVRHGGHMWAESIEGEGSTFFVSLPYEEQESAL
ncbi:MAG TPA: ATP-binding protein [Ktedonobacteraceae bacterium]|nr:ATP-binding protein [Ktedonobacteraceae bacterium]